MNDRQSRRHFSAADKVAILKRHLLEGTPVSQLCEELGIKPNLFYSWQRLLFENAQASFDNGRRARSTEDAKDNVARSAQCNVPRLYGSLVGHLPLGLSSPGDGRLGDTGRARRVVALENEVIDLCSPLWVLGKPPLAEGPENDFRLLVNEVMGLEFDKQLFTFVTTAAGEQPNGAQQPVLGTNNESERTLRRTAAARTAGRANKTIVSVLESLRLYLATFTLTNIIAEIERWRQAGQSCFSELLAKLHLTPPNTSTPAALDKVLPLPDG